MRSGRSLVEISARPYMLGDAGIHGVGIDGEIIIDSAKKRIVGK